MLTEVHKEILTFFNYANLKEPRIDVVEDKEISLYVVKIHTEEESLFLENNQELLFAFQSILKKIIQHSSPNAPDFVIDINEDQQKHINEAKQKAEIAYQRVVQYEKPYEFGYLNGFERMIIHSFLKEKNDVDTKSKGIGKERRLFVLPKN